MSIIAYPLEATEYTAEDVQSYLSTRTSGVYSEEITLTPEGMTATISPFLAWFNYAKFKGCSVAVTAPEVLTFAPASVALDRIDRVVLRLDFSVNKAYFTIIQGEASSTPTPPEVLSVVLYDDYPAKVKLYVPAGSGETYRNHEKWGVIPNIIEYDVNGPDPTSGVGNIVSDNQSSVDVYTLQGALVRKGVKRDEATQGLPQGVYIVGGEKVIVK